VTAISITALEAFGLYLVRTSVLVLGTPILGSGTGFSGYKIALLSAVAITLYLSIGEPLPADVGPVTYGLLCMREILIGLFLAFVLQAVVLAVRVAGEIIGHEMAFNMASIVDPSTGIRTPLITQVYESIFFLGLLAVNGHHWVLQTLEKSFARAPIGSMALDKGVLPLMQELFSHMFKAGITFAAPILVLLVLVSVLIGLMARVVPQVNVLEIGFTLRISVALVTMTLFAPLLAPAMDVLFQKLMVGLDASLDVLGS
jgi:flagellar biosynthesis protein FliR